MAAENDRLKYELTHSQSSHSPQVCCRNTLTIYTVRRLIVDYFKHCFYFVLLNFVSICNRKIYLQPHESQSSTASFAPVLSHVKKTLVRKLGGDTSTLNENLEDSMRQVNKYVRNRKHMVLFLFGYSFVKYSFSVQKHISSIFVAFYVCTMRILFGFCIAWPCIFGVVKFKSNYTICT